MVTELNTVMSSNLRMGRGHGKILGGGMVGKHTGDIMSKGMGMGMGTQARFCRLQG